MPKAKQKDITNFSFVKCESKESTKDTKTKQSSENNGTDLEKSNDENANPNCGNKFKQGDIVWVNLGVSYTWWPGEFIETNKSSENKKNSDMNLKINVSDISFSKCGEQNQQTDKDKLPKVSEVK